MTQLVIAMIAMIVLMAGPQQGPPTGMALARLWAECGGPVPATAIMSCTLLLQPGSDLSKPDQAHAYDLRGRAKGRMGDDTAALDDFAKAIELDPQSAQAYFDTGNARSHQREYALAVAAYSKAIELLPLNAGMYSQRAYAEANLGDFAAALKDADRAVGLAPTSAAGYQARGWTKGRSGDFAGGIADLDKAISLAPNITNLYIDRGVLKAQSGDWAAAVLDYDKAIELAPGNAIAFNDRASAKTRLGDDASALGDYDKAIALDPKYANAYGGRADLRVRQGDLPAALADCDALLKLSPNNRTFLAGCASDHNRAGDTSGAVALYNRIIELDPKDASAFHFRGIVKSDGRDFAGAMDDWRQSVAFDRTQDYVYLRIWLVEARTGSRARATDDLRAVLASRKTDKGNPWVMKIGDYLAGDLPEDDMMKGADDSDAVVSRDRHCEAYFYAGWRHLIDHDDAGARERFAKSVATKSPTMVELVSAAAELKFLARGGGE